jgi:hypothetical protein
MRRSPGWDRREIVLDGEIRTAGELLAAVVAHEVEAFGKRKQAGNLLRVMTDRELREGVEAGRVAFGDQEADARRPDLEAAIATAKQAFLDGLFFLFWNERQVETLDEEIAGPGELLFVRLTALVGG